jgi:hypothetical protein
MEILKIINLALAFLLGCACWRRWATGLHLDQGLAARVGVELGAPILADVIWSIWMAPRASNRLQEPLHLTVEPDYLRPGDHGAIRRRTASAGADLWAGLRDNVILRYIWGQ